jgi:hypothetical protein
MRRRRLGARKRRPLPRMSIKRQRKARTPAYKAHMSRRIAARATLVAKKRQSTKKVVKNVVHSMKAKNVKLVVDFNKQSTNEATAFQPDQLHTFHLNYNIRHEMHTSHNTTTGLIETTPQVLALEKERRSSPSIFLTAFRMEYKIEMSNHEDLDQYGEGIRLRMILVNDKYKEGITSDKDMFAYSENYQPIRDAFGNEADHAAEFNGNKNCSFRDFTENNFFFDRASKLTTALNKKRFTTIKEWKFYFKRRYVGDEQVKRGVIFVPFKNKKVTYHNVQDDNNENTEPEVQPTKNYKLILFYERLNGDHTPVSGIAPLKFKMHGSLYWKDEAPFKSC